MPTKKERCLMHRTVVATRLDKLLVDRFNLARVAIEVCHPSDPYADYIYVSFLVDGSQVMYAQAPYDPDGLVFSHVQLSGLVGLEVIEPVLESHL